MIRQCFLRLSSISLLYTLFAVVFSLLITVAAHPVAAAAGDLDTSFDSDGKVTTEVGSTYDRGRSVAIQSDGKIVAAGYSTTVVTGDFALVRYNTDGSLDTSFDSDGKVTTAIGSGMTMLHQLPSSPTVRLWRRVTVTTVVTTTLHSCATTRMAH